MSMSFSLSVQVLKPIIMYAYIRNFKIAFDLQ